MTQFIISTLFHLFLLYTLLYPKDTSSFEATFTNEMPVDSVSYPKEGETSSSPKSSMLSSMYNYLFSKPSSPGETNRTESGTFQDFAFERKDG